MTEVSWRDMVTCWLVLNTHWRVTSITTLDSTVIFATWLTLLALSLYCLVSIIWVIIVMSVYLIILYFCLLYSFALPTMCGRSIQASISLYFLHGTCKYDNRRCKLNCNYSTCYHLRYSRCKQRLYYHLYLFLTPTKKKSSLSCYLENTKNSVLKTWWLLPKMLNKYILA